MWRMTLPKIRNTTDNMQKTKDNGENPWIKAILQQVKTIIVDKNLNEIRGTAQTSANKLVKMYVALWRRIFSFRDGACSSLRETSFRIT